MGRTRAALIGCGGMGKCHLSSLRAIDEIDLVACCDIAEELLKNRACEYAVPRTYADMYQMLAKEKPDIVAVATQARQHKECVIACADAGVKGVLCEKPMALDLIECDGMLAACERAGTKLAINHQGHCRPSTVHARKLMDDGAIGEPILVRGLNKGGRKAGNELMEMGTHVTDRMLCFGDEAHWVSASIFVDDETGIKEGREVKEGKEEGEERGRFRQAGGQDIMLSKEMDPRDRDAGLVMGHRAFANYGFRSCPIGEVYFHGYPKSDSQRHYGVDLIGTHGQIAVRGGRMGCSVWLLKQPFSLPADGKDEWQAIGVPEEAGAEMDPSVSTMYRELIRSIESGEDHPSSGNVGRHALEMIMGIYESHRLKSRIEFPMKERRHPLERWLSCVNGSMGSMGSMSQWVNGIPKRLSIDSLTH